MASHTVALDSEAYAAFEALKRSEESFSDVGTRLANPRGSILEFAGAWKEIPAEDWNELEASYRRSREADRRRASRLQKARGKD